MNTSKISDLLSDGKVNKAFTKLYGLFPKAEKYILQNSGSKAEALDIFQEALIILHQKHKIDKSVKIEGFVMNTCRFLWQNELRKKKIRIGDSEPLDYLVEDDELEAVLEKENTFQSLDKILLKVSAKCREIFKLFYYQSLSMTEVAKKIGFKSVESAKVQKYKCMEHARNLAIQEQSNLKH
ncbi:MAG: RNA polymerase sigma factor [Crocinitomicaceae bacterium]